MIKKDKRTFADGSTKTYFRVIEGYRPKPGLPPKQRTIKKFGYIEDAEDATAFLQEVEAFNTNYFAEKSLDTEEDVEMYSAHSASYNYGYKFIEHLYNVLEIDDFIEKWQQKHQTKETFSVSAIFKFLIILRIMQPGSKRDNFVRKEQFYDFDTGFELQHIYRCLAIIDAFNVPLQQHIHQKMTELTHRDLSFAFYDVTNFYTEIDFNDTPDEENGILGLRRKGVSKEHQLTPIIQMGLFMDTNGIPINMQVFPGNTSDTKTFQPVLERLRHEFETNKIIVVADKGMNSSDNINYLINNGNGFVFSQILRGTKGKRYHEEALSEDGWTHVETNRYKTCIETYDAKDASGKKVQRQRKVLIYYNDADAKMAKKKREQKLTQAKKETCNNVYDIEKGKERYVAKDIVNKKTGAKIEDIKIEKSVDYDKATEDAKFDGLFCIITSETEYNAQKIRQIYGQLWKIEESFKVMKSGFETRPIFLSKENHIQAHFTTCFVSLALIRLLQYYMGEDHLTLQRLSDVLNAAMCQIDKGGRVTCQDIGGKLDFVKGVNKQGEVVETLKLSTEDAVALDYRKLQKTFHVDFYKSKTKVETFNKFLNSIQILP